MAAATLVFVDVMKELPATLILRPFNFDTLAVQAFRLASDERLSGAAVPSLAIAAIGTHAAYVLHDPASAHAEVTRTMCRIAVECEAEPSVAACERAVEPFLVEHETAVGCAVTHAGQAVHAEA